MINFTRKPHYDYADLLEIIRLLRSEDGCPWDKAQTHKSIRRASWRRRTRPPRPSTTTIPCFSRRSWATC